MSELFAEWIAKAEEDYSVASGLLRRRKVPSNSVCFHCQQAAEKYLKALLQKHNVRFGKTHDLEGLLRMAADLAPSLSLLADDMKLLSDYGVRYRYPGFEATATQARQAGRAARRVRQVLRPLLGG